MNNIGFIFIIAFLFYGIYSQIKMILIGKGVIKDKRFTEEKDLNRLYYKGIVFLILEILILLFFAGIIFDLF